MNSMLFIAWDESPMLDPWDDKAIVSSMEIEVESDDQEWLNGFAFAMQEMSFHSEALFVYREA